jgi:hypothetical protein
MPPLRREKCGFSSAAAAPGLHCVSDYSKAVPTRAANMRFDFMVISAACRRFVQHHARTLCTLRYHHASKLCAAK